jgi:hypothetical protein
MISHTVQAPFSPLVLRKYEDGHIDLPTIQSFFEEIQVHVAAMFP